MSRSLHATRRLPRDPGDLARKRLIKSLVATERLGRAGLDAAAVPAAAIPIQGGDDGRFVHYPASPDDLRAVMARVPAGCLAGLGVIDAAAGYGRRG